MLAGTLEVQCGDERYRAEPETFAFLPLGIPHTFRVIAGPARLLTFAVPGGLEAFFREAGHPAQGPGLPPPTPVDADHLKRVGARHQSEIIGLPLS